MIINCEPTNIFRDSDLIGKDKKSVTYSLEFQHTSRTLEDKEVNSIVNKIISSINTTFNAILRS